MDWFLAVGVGVIALMVVAVHGMIARENAMRDEREARAASAAARTLARPEAGIPGGACAEISDGGER